MLERREFLKRTGRILLAAPVIMESQLHAMEQQPLASDSSSNTRIDGLLRLDVRAFGAVGDSNTNNTLQFQQAIDRCAALGGGAVTVPSGRYLIGGVALRSNVQLVLSEGAVLEGSENRADYPVSQVRWEGKWIQGHTALIYAIDAINVGIVGPGTIAGSSELGGRPNAEDPLRRPALIEFIRCRNINLEQFSTTYSHMWSIHPTDCEDVVIRDLKIRSTGGNGDGIDIDSCRRVWIDNCDISTGDDCISLKSGRGQEGWSIRHATEDVRITYCTLADSIFACIGIGSETSGGISNVRIEHCKFTHAHTYAIYIKTRVGRGAFIEDIVANDLDVSGMEGGFLRMNLRDSGLQDEKPVDGLDGIPATARFRFSNIRLNDCPVLVNGTSIPAEKPLNGFSLTNVKGTCSSGISLAHVRQAEIRDIHINGYTGPLIQIDDVTGAGLEGAMPLERPLSTNP
jgi:polygalacturonase